MIIDAHAHVFTRDALRKLERGYGQYVPRLAEDARGRLWIVTGGRASGPTDPMPQFWDIKERLRLMAEEEIDMQVVSVTPGNFCYDAPAEAGRAIAAAQNDAIAKLVEDHPDHFVGCATVPLQDIDATVAELDRSVKDLGFRAVEIGSNVNGTNLDSMTLWPFYEAAERLGVPIEVHPTSNVWSERMGKYYLGNIVGNPAETTLAIGSVILGGVAERFPGLRFVWAHGGGFFPYQVGRFDHGWEVRQEPKMQIRKKPSSFLGQMYFDTITHWETSLRYLIEAVGVDRVLLGTDFSWDMGDYDIVGQLRNAPFLDEVARRKLLGENSVKLFKIKDN